MFNLANLLQVLRRLGVDPDEIRLPMSVYERLVAQAEEIADGEEEE